MQSFQSTQCDQIRARSGHREGVKCDQIWRGDFSLIENQSWNADKAKNSL